MSAARVIERTFDAEGDAEDRPSTYEAADVLAGRRLDRRRRYAIIKGQVCVLIQWSTACSGCLTHGCGSDRGVGCHECGYAGRRRDRMWVLLGADPESEETP